MFASDPIPTSLSSPPSTYTKSVKADDAWAAGFFGTGVGVAVIDTGVSPVTDPDFSGAGGTSRITASVTTSSFATGTQDGYGHGTHVAGTIAGDGTADPANYRGVAPKSNVVNVKISDDVGNSGIGDLIAGLAWVMQHKNSTTSASSIFRFTLQWPNRTRRAHSTRQWKFSGRVAFSSSLHPGTRELGPQLCTTRQRTIRS